MLASHTIIDGFLGPALSQELLDFALAHEAHFTPTLVYGQDGSSDIRPENRTSFHFVGDWSPVNNAFGKAIKSRLAEITAGAGCPDFHPEHIELELVATRDGGHFMRHIDTRTQVRDARTDRIVSAVYYFHRQPAGFTGGELVLHALVGDESKVIEPKHDRLAVFSSIAPHEVARTQVPGDAFADARFSINCWLHRERK